MVFLDSLKKGLWAVCNIGITPALRPEEAKHIQYFNIGALVMVATNIVFYLKDLPQEKTSPIAIAQLSTAVLGLVVFLLHKKGRFTAGRIYGFLLFYAELLVAGTLSGRGVVDHYFIFVAIAYAFLVFPRKEKAPMIVIITLGLASYLTLLVLYETVEPLHRLDQSVLDAKNRVILFAIFAAFTVFMISGRNFINKAEYLLMIEREKISEMADLLKKMFGQYLSAEVMNSFIANPSALELGGERRQVAIMMTDLRGFTSLSERLEPERVVQMLNAYFEIMVEIALKYNGTINKIIGDGLLIIFGAPQQMPDRARRAVACAIEMQNAMAAVNGQNREQGLPELEMGIGLNETDAIVGNIGSSKRSSYSVVGSGVNMASRIESYTVGGQILISESVRKEAGEILRIDSQRDVFPKGSETPLRVYEVGGIAGDFNLTLTERAPDLIPLNRQIPIRFTVLEQKDAGNAWNDGLIDRLSKTSAGVVLGDAFDVMTNLKMNLVGVDEKLSVRNFYGKVTRHTGPNGKTHQVHFTAVPPEVDAYFQAFRQVCCEIG